MTCCDGTGWTGNPSAPCPEHYQTHDLTEFYYPEQESWGEEDHYGS